jgi:hypothetical protein
MINKELRENAKKLGFYSGIPLGDRGEQDNEIFLALLNNFMLDKYEYNIATYYDTYDNHGWYWTISYSNGLIQEQSENYIFSKIEALEKGLIKLVNDYIKEL